METQPAIGGHPPTVCTPGATPERRLLVLGDPSLAARFPAALATAPCEWAADPYVVVVRLVQAPAEFAAVVVDGTNLTGSTLALVGMIRRHGIVPVWLLGTPQTWQVQEALRLGAVPIESPPPSTPPSTPPSVRPSAPPVMPPAAPASAAPALASPPAPVNGHAAERLAAGKVEPPAAAGNGAEKDVAARPAAGYDASVSVLSEAELRALLGAS